MVLALFWCNQAESGGAIVKKPRHLIECPRVPTPSLTKTDSTVSISLKTWDFLVPGDSDLHQKRARTRYLRMILECSKHRVFAPTGTLLSGTPQELSGSTVDSTGNGSLQRSESASRACVSP